jgi:hypothetical protein
VDQSGNAYVTSVTNSPNFPTANPLQASNGGELDAFVSLISSNVAAAGIFRTGFWAIDSTRNWQWDATDKYLWLWDANDLYVWLGQAGDIPGRGGLQWRRDRRDGRFPERFLGDRHEPEWCVGRRRRLLLVGPDRRHSSRFAIVVRPVDEPARLTRPI